MTRRAAVHDWRTGDLEEHGRILDAVEAGRADEASALMETHVRDALRHWQPGDHD